MAQKFLVRFAAVAEFFKDSSRQLSRGENAVASGHVHKVIFNPEVQPALLKGEVHASMRDKVYNIEVSIHSDGTILNASCTCPRGEVTCHHIAALCVYAHHNVSVTDTACMWNVQKSNMEEVQTIEDMYPKKDPSYSAVSRPNTEEEITNFKASLESLHIPVGFTWLLSEEIGVACDIIVRIENLLFCDEYVKAADKLQYFIEHSHVSNEKVMEVVEATVGQACNENWLICRKNRLTASKFGLVLSACGRNRFPPSLFANLAEGYDLERVKAIQWGRENEKSGIDFFKKETGWDVTPTGFWLDTCGFIGASPDGLVQENAIIEVKCPYKYRNSSLEAVLKSDKTYAFYIEDGTTVVLNKKHSYYHQIQGQLYLTKKEKCYLVVWTPAEAIIVEVAKAAEWENNLSILKEFYLNKYVPYICGKQY